MRTSQSLTIFSVAVLSLTGLVQAGFPHGFPGFPEGGGGGGGGGGQGMSVSRRKLSLLANVRTEAELLGAGWKRSSVQQHAQNGQVQPRHQRRSAQRAGDSVQQRHVQRSWLRPAGTWLFFGWSTSSRWPWPWRWLRGYWRRDLQADETDRLVTRAEINSDAESTLGRRAFPFDGADSSSPSESDSQGVPPYGADDASSPRFGRAASSSDEDDSPPALGFDPAAFPFNGADSAPTPAFNPAKMNALLKTLRATYDKDGGRFSMSITSSTGNLEQSVTRTTDYSNNSGIVVNGKCVGDASDAQKVFESMGLVKRGGRGGHPPPHQNHPHHPRAPMGPLAALTRTATSARCTPTRTSA